MKNAALAITLCLAMFPFYAVGALSANMQTSHCAKTGNGCTLSTSGAIRLSRADKNIAINIDPSVKGDLKVFHSEANNRDSIRGAFFLNNTSNKKIFIKYRLVFKDNIGPVAQTTGEIHLKPGRQRKKIGNIVLGNQDLKNIHSYQIHMVVSQTPLFRH